MAVWSIEQEVYASGSVYKRSDTGATVGGALASNLATRANYFISLVPANASGFYGVQVMQLWNNYSGGVFSGNKQDQLIWTPQVVPDASSTFFGLLFGVSLLGAARRQFGA